MDFKNTKAELTTITRNVNDIEDITGNIYESCNIISRRSNQIAVELKEELTGKLNEFASTSDNLEEVFENREQIEISRFYESLPKTNAIAIKELLEDKIYVRNSAKEETDK